MWPTEGSSSAAPPLTPRARRALLLGGGGMLAAVVIATAIAIRASGPSAPSYSVSGAGVAALWVSDGGAFRALRATAQGPRSNHIDMAFDSGSGLLVAWDHGCARVVMGFTGGCAESVDQTWTWNGQAWIARAASSQPVSTGAGAMGWDPERQAVVYANRGGQAWAWRDSNWRSLALRPPKDLAGTGAIAVGVGPQLVFVTSDSTWDWYGGTWTRHSGGIDPADARVDSAQLVDQRLYVGRGSTWTYAGGSWLQSPQPSLASPTAAYDGPTSTFTMIDDNGTTWTWSGTGWLQGPPGPAFPANRSGAYPAPLIYDDGLGRLVALVSAA